MDIKQGDNNVARGACLMLTTEAVIKASLGKCFYALSVYCRNFYGTRIVFTDIALHE